MSKQAKPAAAKQAITQRLSAIYDHFDPAELVVGMAQEVAEAEGLDRTSAQISYCRWKALRLAAVAAQQPAANKGSKTQAA